MPKNADSSLDNFLLNQIDCARGQVSAFCENQLNRSIYFRFAFAESGLRVILGDFVNVAIDRIYYSEFFGYSFQEMVKEIKKRLAKQGIFSPSSEILEEQQILLDTEYRKYFRPLEYWTKSR